MSFNKGNIVKFQDPWFTRLTWLGRKLLIFERKKCFQLSYIITGYMNSGHLNKIISNKSGHPVIAEILEVKHNDLFVVQESFSFGAVSSIVIKEFNSKTNLQYVTISDNYIVLSPDELSQHKRNIRKQKMKKINSSKTF